MTTCHDTARDLLLFLLFTGLRDSEAKGLKWEDVGFVEKTFTVRNNKGKSDHSLPMGSFIYALLLTRYNAKDHHSMYVFPNPKGTNKIGGIRKQIIKAIDKYELPFSLHDLRRTYATLLEQELETSPRVVGRLLDHAPRGVTEQHYLKTKATNFDPLANNLYNWVVSNHDWTDDDGKGRISRKWI